MRDDEEDPIGSAGGLENSGGVFGGDDDGDDNNADKPLEERAEDDYGDGDDLSLIHI